MGVRAQSSCNVARVDSASNVVVAIKVTSASSWWRWWGLLDWDVLASVRSADVNGVRVVVIAILVCLANWRKDALSSLRVALSNQSRSALADNFLVNTLSSCKVARVGGAWVVVVAILCMARALSFVASGDGTLVLCKAEGSVDASNSVDVRVLSARVVVVAVRNWNEAASSLLVANSLDVSSVACALDWLKDASFGAIAVSLGAEVRSMASTGLLDDSLLWRAVEDEAVVSVLCNELSRDVSENTVSGLGVASVLGASIVVVADLVLVNTLSA